MMRGILRFVSRNIFFHIAVAVVIGLAISYAIVPVTPGAPKLRSEEGVLDLTQASILKTPLKLQGNGNSTGRSCSRQRIYGAGWQAGKWLTGISASPALG